MIVFPHKLSIITGVCGRNEITEEWLETTVSSCKDQHELIIVSNGSTSEENSQLILWLDKLRADGWSTLFVESTDPLGTTAAFNLGVANSTGELSLIIHNDLLIKQDGWDRDLISFFDKTPQAGVVGLAGAKMIGHPQIYSKPYELLQLQRFVMFSSLEDWDKHGYHASVPTPVAVLDGIFLCSRREDIVRLGGFDQNYVHHMYDNDFCLKFFYEGKTNYVIPITCQHLNGQTANYPRYNEWLKSGRNINMDAEIHKLSHEFFYNKWRGKLPAKTDDLQFVLK